MPFSPPSMSEMFSAWLSPPVPRWLLVFGDWFYLITTYRTARPTHKISGRNSVPDSTECRLKIVFTSTLFWLGLIFFYSSIKSTDDDMLWILQMGPVHEGAQQVRAELHAERWEVLLPTQAQSHRRYSLWRTRRNWRLRCRPMFGEFYFLFLLIREWLGELRD